jgi:NadR type nicotinamide-nucleotide adenylyltransferase
MLTKETIIKKVVVVGPESTGKTTLCKKLAAHYNTICVEEYAREYLLKNGTDYSFDNLLDVARGQLEGEESGIRNWQLHNQKQDSQPVFIDTDMYVMKVWCEFVFDRCHHWILNRIVERKYDLYLLCNTDAPWVKDELREYPDLETREKLFNHYKDIMVNQHVPWVEISGKYDERLQKAIDAVDSIT